MIFVIIKKYLFICCFIIFIFHFCHAICVADSILMKSKDKELKLSGKVIELTKGIVSILGEDGQITNVNWVNISFMVIGDQVFITMATDERILGSLELENGQVFINSATLGTIKSSPNNIVAIERRKLKLSPELALAPQKLAGIRGTGNQSLPSEEEKKPESKKGKEKTSEAGGQARTIGEKGGETSGRNLCPVGEGGAAQRQTGDGAECLLL